jgi:hypothetical protein
MFFLAPVNSVSTSKGSTGQDDGNAHKNGCFASNEAFLFLLLGILLCDSTEYMGEKQKTGLAVTHALRLEVLLTWA